MKPDNRLINVFVVSTIFLSTLASVSYAGSLGRDPFAYGSMQDARLESDQFINLQAVIISGKTKIALINGRRYRVGDHVAGASITEIKLTHVVTTKNGRTTTYHLGERKE